MRPEAAVQKHGRQPGAQALQQDWGEAHAHGGGGHPRAITRRQPGRQRPGRIDALGHEQGIRAGAGVRCLLPEDRAFIQRRLEARRSPRRAQGPAVAEQENLGAAVADFPQGGFGRIGPGQGGRGGEDRAGRDEAPSCPNHRDRPMLMLETDDTA